MQHHNVIGAAHGGTALLSCRQGGIVDGIGKFSEMAMRFQELIEEREGDRRFDPELWRFMDRVSLNLRNATDTDLIDRWLSIARNILYLLDAARDQEPAELKYVSSWWWLQTLVHTEAELERRHLPRPAAPDVPACPHLRPEFRIERAVGPRLWARVGETRHLIETLREGKIRFRPASSYGDTLLNKARRDLELEKIRKRPGQALVMTGPDGRSITPIGDVSFSRRSAIEIDGSLRNVEYWISSWSLEFDPRLLSDFSHGNGPPCDGSLVIWDTASMGDRTELAVNRHLRGWRFADIAIRYFDPYDLQPVAAWPASMEKDFAFAYQRELRLSLMPPTPVERGEPMFLHVGSLMDIAGLYSADGHKIEGKGPGTFLTCKPREGI
jgi:hypothetical protein